ncbi:MAG: ATP-binding protein [Thermodesulfobacteriota bacterium]
MRRARPKALFLPVVGLLAAAVVLLTVVAMTTYFNLERAGFQARRVLDAQATAIVSGLAAGLRTGWRHWVWRADSLQGLVQEMAQTSDVAFITLLDQGGLVLAHSNPRLVGLFPAKIRPLIERLEDDQIKGWLANEDLYVAGRRLRPEEFGPGLGPGRQGMMMRDRMEELEKLRPSVIIVGLHTKTYQDARSRQIQHAIIMAGLLFILGSAAIYFIFIVQNYRTIERTLTELNSYTASIVDKMPAGLITLDALGEPVMINRSARRMFGWGEAPEKILVRQPVIQALSREFGPRLGQGETIIEKEFEAPLDPQEPLPLAVSAAYFPAETGSGLVFILRDLRQIRALEDQVRQSEKLAAVGRLAAGIAHEVRNPLSSMRGLARFLARGLDEKSREAEYLKVMVEEIDRLNRVITGLLDFARPRPPDLKPLDLNEIARHTTSLISDDLQHHGISLREDLAPGRPLILADRDMAVQAMLNLLLNALEAMPEGGRLTVSTKTNQDLALFVVEDTGPGLPIKDRSRLVDPFFTTKKKGTGLGLTQVAGIMEAHGGKLELGGEPGLGARVCLYFPLNSNSTPEAP